MMKDGREQDAENKKKIYIAKRIRFGEENAFLQFFHSPEFLRCGWDLSEIDESPNTVKHSWDDQTPGRRK